mmetsp:Transcript_74737/g.194432  ORF Transcript_74737/g.194432 Transcript_74737/m.194432 type:complete len:233 (+) Transcript_74737:377-1075(+)
MRMWREALPKNRPCLSKLMPKRRQPRRKRRQRKRRRMQRKRRRRRRRPRRRNVVRKTCLRAGGEQHPLIPLTMMTPSLKWQRWWQPLMARKRKRKAQARCALLPPPGSYWQMTRMRRSLRSGQAQSQSQLWRHRPPGSRSLPPQHRQRARRPRRLSASGGQTCRGRPRRRIASLPSSAPPTSRHRPQRWPPHRQPPQRHRRHGATEAAEAAAAAAIAASLWGTYLSRPRGGI